MIGFDGEWKFKLIADEEQIMSIIQIATDREIFIFDVLTMRRDAQFYDLMDLIFSSDKILKVGHSPMNDLNMLNAALRIQKKPKIGLNQCINVAPVFRREYGARKVGLAFISQELFKKKLSKYEQVSNWNNRPLRKAQLHYAGLDAFILIQIYKKFQRQLPKVNLLKYFEKYEAVSDHLESNEEDNDELQSFEKVFKRNEERLQNIEENKLQEKNSTESKIEKNYIKTGQNINWIETEKKESSKLSRERPEMKIQSSPNNSRVEKLGNNALSKRVFQSLK